MIVLGSKALHLNLNNDIARFNRSDIDVVMSMDDFSAFISKNQPFITKMIPTSSTKYSVRLTNQHVQYYEIEISFKGSSQWLLDNQSIISSGVWSDVFGNDFHFVNNEVLYLTKKSHIHYPIHYDKNIADYSLLKTVIDDEKVKTYQLYYDLRLKETKDRINKRLPTLNRTNEDFFDRSKNVVGYVFEHDDIHEAIKHYERPVYEMMKKDFSKAWCEKDMFYNLPHEYKVRCVQEEAYVIALERYIILRKGYYKDPRLAYKSALQRICTTLCSGFFRDFAVENYFEILNAYSDNYVNKFKEKLFSGLVKKLDHVAHDKYEAVLKHMIST